VATASGASIYTLNEKKERLVVHIKASYCSKKRRHSDQTPMILVPSRPSGSSGSCSSTVYVNDDAPSYMAWPHISSAS